MKKIFVAIIALLAGLMVLTACSDADVVSKNLSKAADNFQVQRFQVQRQIVFYNGITGEYVAEVDGLCSVDTDSTRNLSVTCKVGKDKYIKNYLGLSDNVAWFALQTSPKTVSTSKYKVIFKPSTVISDFDLR